MIRQLLYFCVAFFSFSIVAAAQTTLPISGSSEEGKQILTNTTIELFGPEAATEFYYKIENEQTEGDYFVQFYIEHSSLLIDPSAVTLYVDGNPVQSYKLSEPLKEIKYVLPKEALTEGTHTIKLAFTGYLIQGACPPQDSNANWLTVQINSFLNLPVTTASTPYLNHYPEKFQRDTQIIVPTAPTLKTLEAALEIAQYLPDAEIVEEQDVKELSSNFLLVGVYSDFKVDAIRALLKSKLNGLHLSTQLIANETNYARMFQVIASDEEALGLYPIVTTAHLVEQLSGQDMTITTLPNTEKIQLDETITMDELGLTSFTLDKNMTSTNTYFYYLPMSKFRLQNPSITLNFKRSNLIRALENSSGITNQTELVIYLNEVPHAIDLTDYPADELATVTIPFDAEVIKDSQLLSVRFAGNGLVQKNPCYTTDQTNWIYIDESSHVNLPVKDGKNNQTLMFKQFPFPFMEPRETLYIVKAKDVTLKELQELYKALALQTQLATIELVESITVEQLEKGHVIFIGGVAQHPILADAKNLIVEYKDNRANLADEGFLETDTTTYAFVQQNPWNEVYSMLVLDRLSATTPYVKTQTLTYLRNNDSSGNVLVEQYEIVTNEELLAKENDPSERTSTNWVYVWIAALIGFIVIVLFMMLYFKRRKKKIA